MFLTVIVAYLIAAAFALCGVVNIVGCIMASHQGMGAFLFMEGMAAAMWPLGVAAALLLLIQTSSLVERWMLLWTISQAPPRSTAAPSPKASRNFPHTPAPAEKEERIDASPEAPAEPQRSQDSPSPAVSQPQPPASSPAQQREGLNFFKLD